MVTQTHDDWRRMLEAIWVAGWYGDMPKPDTIDEAHLWGVVATKQAPYTSGYAMVAVARALGIDKRRRQENWPDDAEDGNTLHGVTETAPGEWMATVYRRRTPGCLVSFRVTGHPTRESAIGHLERLLGRDAAEAAADGRR